MVRSSGFRQGPRDFDFRFSILVILKKKIIEALTARGLNFDEFNSGGLYEKHAVATWEPSQHLLKDRETKKTCVEMAGRRTFRMHTDFEPAVRQTSASLHFENYSFTTRLSQNIAPTRGVKGPHTFQANWLI
jgi:hypothetical protein